VPVILLPYFVMEPGIVRLGVACLALVAAVSACGRVEVSDSERDAGAGDDALMNIRGPAPKPTDAGAGAGGGSDAGTGKDDARDCTDGACTGGCTPGASRCNGNILQTCGADGLPADQVCPYVCLDGQGGAPSACAGVCVPGTSACDASGSAETCSATGDWMVSPCPFLCTDGRCTGSCKPGDLRCDGTTPERCGDDGAWKSGTACPVVCSGGECTDGCTPGAHQCTGTVPETCDGSGRWQAGARCPFVCAGGVCGGSCVPGGTQCAAGNLQTCDASGAWQTTGKASSELLVNPAFDLGPDSGWMTNGMIIFQDDPTLLDTASDTPPYLAWLGGYMFADDDLWQTVTVPASTVSLTLSFNYKVFTEESSKGAAYDFMSVEVHGPNGAVAQVGQLSDNSATDVWTRFTAVLPPALAGQTVELHFHATTDGSLITSFYVDTASLQAVGCP
jgi:hypothetical protein